MFSRPSWSSLDLFEDPTIFFRHSKSLWCLSNIINSPICIKTSSKNLLCDQTLIHSKHLPTHPPETEKQFMNTHIRLIEISCKQSTSLLIDDNGNWFLMIQSSRKTNIAFASFEVAIKRLSNSKSNPFVLCVLQGELVGEKSAVNCRISCFLSWRYWGKGREQKSREFSPSKF
jgi:hypothetical protein